MISAALFRFPPELELSFAREQAKRGVKAVRSTAAVTLAIVIAFAFWRKDGDGVSPAALKIYFGVIAPCLLLLIGATFRRELTRRLHWISAAVMLAAFGLGTVQFMRAFPEKIPFFQPGSAMLVTLALYVALRLPLPLACGAGGLFSGFVLTAASRFGIFGREAFSIAALHLTAMNVLSAYVAYSLELGRRRDFLSRREIAAERDRSERLLLNVLPFPVAQRLKSGEETIADDFEEVSILFADIVGYTTMSGRMRAVELVALLNDVFSRFDALLEENGIEKIKTIGDSYMAVAGLPGSRGDSAEAAARLALAMLAEVKELNRDRGLALDIRIGVNTGPAVAGVIGSKKFSYDLWGDAVNIASRMESSGQPGRIHVSEKTAAKLSSRYELQPRGSVEIKGKGPMTTYFLGPAKPQASKA